MDAQSARRRLPRFVRIIRARPRLMLSTLVGIVVVVLLPAPWRPSTRALIGWDIGVAVYLTAAGIMVARSDIARIRRHAALQDEGQLAILALTVAAALATLGAILADLSSAPPGAARPASALMLATVTIVLSWTFVHAIFALHYAHEFYGARGHHGGGLAFPGGEEPDYWDFLYFSLVIGMTSQVSDVGVTSRSIRRTVAAHGVISFAFNATLIALTVNIAASALAG